MSWDGRDSSFNAPTLVQAKAARARGVRVWGGYFGSRPGLGLAVLWNRMSFWNLQQADIIPIAFCSGFDDPDWVRRTAAEWGILACVDVEHGIRDNGPWVRDWVQRARSGLYGLASVHYRAGEPTGRGATFNVVARYLFSGCTGATWDPVAGPRPPGPCGWQCQGSHVEFGLGVDRAFYDESIASLLPGGAPIATPTGGEMGITSQNAGAEPFEGIYIRDDDRHILLADWIGGAGFWDNYAGGLTDVGRPPGDALPWKATVAFTTHVTGHLRWNVEAITDDGVAWLLVFGDELGNGNAIVQPWQRSKSIPKLYVPSAPGADSYTDQKAVDAVANKLSAKA